MHTYSMELGGRTLTMEIGKIAKQANGAVLVRYGDTAVVVAVTGTKTPREGVDFFPLTVDFEEKMYAVGKIPGGFIKREGRPGEQAIFEDFLRGNPGGERLGNKRFYFRKPTGGKRCVLCRQAFASRAKNQRYCPACAAKQKRLKAAERQRRKRASASRF